MIALVLLKSSSICFSQDANNRAYVLFLYSFTKYIQWPSMEGKSHFAIGVVGNSSIIGELELLAATKKAGDLPIKIVIVNSESDLTQIQLLFLPQTNSERLPQILEAVGNKPVLVVCEADGMVNKGACISFLSLGQSVLRFELNKEATVAHSLRVSKNLESLAYRGT
jgi:hypothetical protein